MLSDLALFAGTFTVVFVVGEIISRHLTLSAIVADVKAEVAEQEAKGKADLDKLKKALRIKPLMLVGGGSGGGGH